MKKDFNFNTVVVIIALKSQGAGSINMKIHGKTGYKVLYPVRNHS